ncbi:MAG TPA: hypothetical protein DD727_06720 [Clostridiales bacterium]|nr:hypothetical protein [Clostridiales bacterium]
MFVSGIFGVGSEKGLAKVIRDIFNQKGKTVKILRLKAPDEMDAQRMAAYLKALSICGTEVLVMSLPPEYSEHPLFDEVKLDLVICRSGVFEKHPAIYRRILDILSPKGILVLDEENLSSMIQDLIHREGWTNPTAAGGIPVLTYGFGRKASISASSTGEDILGMNYLLCLKEPVPTLPGNTAEPQEYKLEHLDASIPGNDILAAAALGILNEVL